MMLADKRRRFAARVVLCIGWSIVAIALPATPHTARAQSDLAWPGDDWQIVNPSEVGLNVDHLAEARDYALQGDGAGIIARHGKIVMSWGDLTQTFDLKSTTKSFGSAALGLALRDGLLELNQSAAEIHPGLGVDPESNLETGWLDQITIFHLAAQTAGFAKPGGYERLLFEPGTQWHYSDGGPNWLAECVTLRYECDINDLMFDRVFTPIGITKQDLRWRNHQYRPHDFEGYARREFGSGIHANVNAMARFGLLYARHGRWQEAQILSESFVELATTTIDPENQIEEHSDAHGNASAHYGLLWWNNADGAIPGIPTNTYWSWGLHDSLIVVFPDWDIIVARAGRSWHREDDWGHFDVLAPFLQAIAASVEEQVSPVRNDESNTQQDDVEARLPYPRSEMITSIDWAPVETVNRAARGSDNWPLTWADDDALYTAYGDGFGFDPRVEEKLSLGLARVFGGPADFRGENLRSDSIEASGDGASGRKASGILMVEGVLYLAVRNADNSQLAYSLDHGQSWDWAEWRFDNSFGYPTFLNFGMNYQGARDRFVYLYSHDHASAYQAADSMVLARVDKQDVLEQSAYEYFAGLDEHGEPTWSDDVAERAAVFSHPGNCYRSSISYHAPLGVYLWCQVLPPTADSRGPRFEGGFGIYESPNPWGPWRTVFFTSDWDMGPGETNSIPTKWISEDGTEIHLVFSGEDCFSVRKGTLRLTR